jgi:hypothetical protein
MSGTGAAIAPRMQHAHLQMPNWDPTHGCAPAVEAERAAAVEHIRRKVEAVKAKSGCTIPVAEAGHLVRVLDELAEDLGRGLHVA